MIPGINSSKLLSITYLLTLCSLPPLAAQDLENVPDDRRIVIDANIPEEHWNGWGDTAPPPGEDDEPEAGNGQSLVVVEYLADDSEPRRFSGKVLGPDSMDGVEVGLISLVGIHWIDEETYQWEPVKADGSFEIVDGPKFPNARKAIVVRGPDTPWTFLNYNFQPNEGGEEIVLPADEPKTVRITVSGLDGENFEWFGVEPFHAFTQYDAEGNSLRRQRMGYHNSKDQKHLDLVLPTEPVALFVHHKGHASCYAKIDPREAEHFHFILKPAGKLEITVVDEEGQPVEGAEARWINPAAPLSIGRGTTDAEGKIFQESLVPGTFGVSIGGFSQSVEVDSKNVAKVQLIKTKDDEFQSKDQFEARAKLQIRMEFTTTPAEEKPEPQPDKPTSAE